MAFSFVLLLFFILHGAEGARIIGGREAVPNSRPYIVSLQTNGGHRCGGVLVREDFVLSAAHCAIRGQLRVVLGAHSLRSNEPTKQVFTAVRTFIHPNFNSPADLDNDIMLLKLNGRAQITQAVQTIPMRRNQVAPNTQCLAAGWGAINNNNQNPDRLQEVNMRILTQQSCRRTWNALLESQVCGLGAVGAQGICFGDSGGPLVCNGQVTGLSSFVGRPCGDVNIPDVFTRVSSFTSWIANVMNNN